ncbi:MAG: NAD-dependent epimerase/dehydratase family protein [Prolixibacteraceae bacterium]
MKSILITGGAGFIGSNLARKLIAKGYRVRILDSLSRQIHGPDPEITSPLYKAIKDQVDFLKGDISSGHDLEEAVFGQDAVIHLAAETGTGQSMYEIKRYSDTNMGGTALLLDFLTNKKHQVRKIVVASSRAVYGEGKYHCAEHGTVYPEARKAADMQNGDFECKCPRCNQPATPVATTEDSKIHPASVYGITKQVQEQLAITVGRSINIPVVALRYQNVYGPGQSLSNPYTGILSIFSTQIRNGSDINIFEDGQESRDFVYIDDVTDATVMALENDEANYQAFNVGSGKPVSVLKVAETLRENYHSGVRINISGNYRVGDIRHNYAALSKIAAILNYRPRFSFENGIAAFCRWVAKQDPRPDQSASAIEELKKKGLYR